MQDTHEQPNSSENRPGRAGSGSGSRRQRTLLVRYGKMGLLGQFSNSGKEIPPGVTHAVIQTDRGLEIGEIVAPYCQRRGSLALSGKEIETYCRNSGGDDYPLTRRGKVIRLATAQDLNEQRHLDRDARKEMGFCQELIDKHNLPMQLVDAEHLFGGDRIIYYFMADGRVDFRQLVKELAHEYQTRVEMRQIGVRDEARLIADFETCGRQCCCRSFLKVLQPVNMRMAKLQKATLDPAKISGRCGRLKCCLRYEDQVYTELNKKLPRKGMIVLTEHGYGPVVETQVITQLVKIRTETNQIIAVANDEILERNYKPPQSTQGGAEPARTDRRPRRAAPEAAPATNEPNGSGEARKRRRRRRRKKTPDEAGANQQREGDSNGSADQAGASQRREGNSNHSADQAEANQQRQGNSAAGAEGPHATDDTAPVGQREHDARANDDKDAGTMDRDHMPKGD